MSFELELTALDYSKYSLLKVDVADRIAIVRLNSPGTLNSFTRTLHRQVESVLLDVAGDDAVDVIVLTGEGRAFSSGGNVKAMNKRADTRSDTKQTDRWTGVLGTHAGAIRLIENLLNCTKPIIAAINGDAMGLGATLALMCDISVISDSARLGDTHARVGLVAGDGGAIIWPLLIGVNRAKEYLMTGRVLRGADAAKLGLVNHSVPAARVMALADEIARELAALPPLALRWTKLSLNKALKQRANLILDAGLAFEMLSMLSKDHRHAVASFVEKRKPDYQGY
jgi:enoyl-CoA hydratase